MLTSAVFFVRGHVKSSRTNTTITSWLIHTAVSAKIVAFYAFIDIFGKKEEISRLKAINTKDVFTLGAVPKHGA